MSPVANVRAIRGSEPLAIRAEAELVTRFVPGNGVVPVMNWRYSIDAKLMIITRPVRSENQSNRRFRNKIRMLPSASLIPRSIRPGLPAPPSGCAG